MREPVTLEQIETRARQFAEAREKLAEIVTALNDGIEALKRRHMRPLKAAVSRAAEKYAKAGGLAIKGVRLAGRPSHGVEVWEITLESAK